MKSTQKYNTQFIAQSFSSAANTYDQSAIMQYAVAQDLLKLLDSSLNPETLLDLGSGTGRITAQLQQKFPQASCLAIDIAFDMLDYAQTQYPDSGVQWFCADADHLPFSTATVDLIFSNLMLQWSGDCCLSFKELYRLLKEEGVLIFSTLGPNSLMELRNSWQTIDSDPHVHSFLDKDSLVRALTDNGFTISHFETINHFRYFSHAIDLMREIKNIGARNSMIERNKGLLSRNKLALLTTAYERYRNAQGLLPTTYEVFLVIVKKMQ